MGRMVLSAIGSPCPTDLRFGLTLLCLIEKEYTGSWSEGDSDCAGDEKELCVRERQRHGEQRDRETETDYNPAPNG